MANGLIPLPSLVREGGPPQRWMSSLIILKIGNDFLPSKEKSGFSAAFPEIILLNHQKTIPNYPKYFVQLA